VSAPAAPAPPERLWALMPSVHRRRDAGGALRAYLALIDGQMAEVEDEIRGLYENWFIETCAPWAIEPIGHLLGVRPLQGLGEAHDGRAWVANALRLRRRKGTATMLEQLALDVTGWPACAVEAFQGLAWHQNVNHVRRGRGGTADVRDLVALERVGGPFEPAARTPDVRPPDREPGRHNVPNVLLFLHRARAFPVGGVARDADGAATEPGGADARELADGWAFHPLGLDTPLFAPGRTEPDVAHLAGPVDVPAPLRPFALHFELEARRAAVAAGAAPEPLWFGDVPPFQVWLAGEPDPVPPEQVAICDLRAWRKPTGAIRVAVDPLRGRLTVKGAAKPAVRLSWHRGAAGEIGGGPYARRIVIGPSERPPAGATRLRQTEWQLGVTKDAAQHEPDVVVGTLAAAVTAWNATPAGTSGVIALLDERSYHEPALPGITVKPGSQLAIVAAGWPALHPPGGGPPARALGRIVPDGHRPHVRATLRVTGQAPSSPPPAGQPAPPPGELVLDGLLLEGDVEVAPGDLGLLRIAHCTLAPGGAAAGAVSVAGTAAGRNAALRVELDRSFLGPVRSAAAVRLAADGCVLDGRGGPALAAPDATAALLASTLLGAAGVHRVDASDCIFEGPLTAARRQAGCVRYSWLPRQSEAPRAYRCQPDLALARRGAVPAADVVARLRPRLASRDVAHPHYARLAPDGAPEVLRGSESGDEMGAFGFLREARRLADLRRELADHLPTGLQAGILLET
jgi:hypothetical protein